MLGHQSKIFIADSISNSREENNRINIRNGWKTTRTSMTMVSHVVYD